MRLLYLFKKLFNLSVLLDALFDCCSQNHEISASRGEYRRCRSRRWRCSARGMRAEWVDYCCFYHRRVHFAVPPCTSYCSSRLSAKSAWSDCWATWSAPSGLPNCRHECTHCSWDIRVTYFTDYLLSAMSKLGTRDDHAEIKLKCRVR